MSAHGSYEPKTPAEALAVARLLARKLFPYFRVALLALIPRESPGLGTLAVSANGILYWDPVVTKIWSIQQLAGALGHEVQHLLRKHHARCAAIKADPRAWNIAADAEINDDFEAGRVELPPGCIYPATLQCPTGLPAEAYLHAAQPATALGSGPPSAQKGPSGPLGDELGGRPCPGAGWCGGAAGRPVPGELAPGEQGQGDGGRSEAEWDRISRQVAEAVRDQASRHPGTVPAGLGRWADLELTPPKVPWQTLLSRSIRSAVAYRPGALDYRYDRPSRRQSSVPKVILPALRIPVPEVAFAVDTSGSMGVADLSRAVSEARGVLRAINAEVTVIACDTEVHSNRRVRTWAEIPKLLRGGGGTDFDPIFRAVEGLPKRPSVLILATDGCGPATAPPRGCSVIWLLIGGRVPPVPWGTPVVVE